MSTQDDVIGRARVSDTPELETYYAQLAKLGAGALWTVAHERAVLGMARGCQR
jgi:hypothetical protein